MSDISGGSAAVGELLVAIWSDLLGQPVTLDTNVLEAGANSIHLLLALNRLQQERGIEIEVAMFFAHPVIGDLATACALDEMADDVEEFLL